MYDELKERCRACSQGCIYPSECSYFDKPPLRCMRQLLSEAADAIEKLQQYAELYKDGGEAVKKAAETYKAAYIAEHDARVAELPRWIPVTERLPEKNGPYLCCWKASADEKMHIARIMIWRADTGWMNAWDEPMSNYVTHWMPLPEPPKEET